MSPIGSNAPLSAAVNAAPAGVNPSKPAPAAGGANVPSPAPAGNSPQNPAPFAAPQPAGPIPDTIQPTNPADAANPFFPGVNANADSGSSSSAPRSMIGPLVAGLSIVAVACLCVVGAVVLLKRRASARANAAMGISSTQDRVGRKGGSRQGDPVGFVVIPPTPSPTPASDRVYAMGGRPAAAPVMTAARGKGGPASRTSVVNWPFGVDRRSQISDSISIAPSTRSFEPVNPEGMPAVSSPLSDLLQRSAAIQPQPARLPEVRSQRRVSAAMRDRPRSFATPFVASTGAAQAPAAWENAAKRQSGGRGMIYGSGFTTEESEVSGWWDEIDDNKSVTSSVTGPRSSVGLAGPKVMRRR
ncbi:hypothetical protein HK101_003402 [Irineochytrium annulatum]|nr:hypothetical protein HK101_003402 [Irineochytrium annulatum]